MVESNKKDFMSPVQQPSALVDIESARAIQEVQAAMTIAKRFPRNQHEAHTRIMKACERYSLADKATYLYPRGDVSVKGGSIRLAEVIAQNWGNLAFGIRELSQTHGRSEAEAFAWDLETNTKQTKTFQVPHIRYSKEKGNVDLTDPRDVYENVANLGARRMRACIFGIIPGDIVEDALAQCEKTLREGNKKKPLKDRIRLMLKSFSDIGVNQDMIETRLDHDIDLITDDELIEINNIGRSIADNMTGREEWFDLGAAKLKDKLKATAPAEAKDNIYEAKEPEKESEPKKKKERKTKDKKEAPKEDKAKVDPISAAYKDLPPKEFKAYVIGQNAAIGFLPQKYQDEIHAKWEKDCPGEPFPGSASKVEETEEPEIPETETEHEKILRLVPEAEFDQNMGQPVVPCPQRDKKKVGANWCKQSCPDPEKEKCGKWTEFDKK